MPIWVVLWLDDIWNGEIQIRRLLTTNLQRNYYILVRMEPCNFTTKAPYLFNVEEAQLLTSSDVLHFVISYTADLTYLFTQPYLFISAGILALCTCILYLFI